MIPTVQALDSGNTIVKGATVIFKPTQGALASAGDTLQLTDTLGRARPTSWKLADVADTNRLTATSGSATATFKVVGKQKQGGNVAAYFCAQDGRVLHAVAGPVNAATMLKEAKWTVETAKAALKDSMGDGAKFKEIFRKAHAAKLKEENGLVVEPVTYDAPEPDPNSALTYRDLSGKPIAPKLPPPPVDGPDVSLGKKDFAMRQTAEAKAPGAALLVDKRGGRWVLGNQGRVHILMAGHSMLKIEKLYGSVFEGILNEKISTKPVEVVTPFPWVGRDGKGG